MIALIWPVGLPIGMIINGAIYWPPIPKEAFDKYPPSTRLSRRARIIKEATEWLEKDAR